MFDGISLENYELSADKFPRARDRAFFDGLPADVKEKMSSGARALSGQPWPQIKFTDCLAFDRTGDRLIMETPHFEKRKRLTKLVAAECFEYNGEYIDEIMNGLMSIASEPFWGVSAHYPKDGSIPQGQRHLYIDLFAAETAALIARTLHLLGDELAAQSEELILFLEEELDRRIKTVFLEYKDFWWMGYDRSRRAKLNNWSPWITSRVLTVFLLTEKDEKRKREGIAKCLEIQNFYLHDIPFDGGVDEGPLYWSVAGAKVLESVNMLYKASAGALDFTRGPQLVNITDFIRKAYVGNGYVINFNDAAPSAGGDVCMLYGFAKTVGCRELVNFALELKRFCGINDTAGNLTGFFTGLEWASEIENAVPDGGFLSRDVYLKGIETAIAHENETEKGLFIAIKGNHNGESHNHNDVGTFTVYKDGSPLIIDLGQGTYVKQTFSDRRYEIANCHSDWHNLPVVNSCGQRVGEEHRAENFDYKTTDEKVEVSMDIARAYPGCGASYIGRSAIFERDKNPQISISDEFFFENAGGKVTENLILAGEIKIESGIITVNNGGAEVKIIPDGECEITAPEKYTDDALILSRWGTDIYRVGLNYTFIGKKGKTGYTVI